MNPLLATVGGKLAERWLSSLMLPGALYVGTAAVGLTLGHARWHDVGLLRGELDELAGHPAAERTGTALLLVAALLLLSTAASLGAQFLGGAIERYWLREATGPLSSAWVGWRVRRWERRRARLAQEYATSEPAAPGPGGRAVIRAADYRRIAVRAHAHERLGPMRPASPTWYGDRMRAAAGRVEFAYRVDLAALWPRLWLMLDEPAQRQIQSARDAFAAAARLAAWGAGYALLGVWWWPAFPVALACAVTAWARAREAVTALAALIEAAVDVHARELGIRAGVIGGDEPGRLRPDAGEEMSELFRKAGWHDEPEDEPDEPEGDPASGGAG